MTDETPPVETPPDGTPPAETPPAPEQPQTPWSKKPQEPTPADLGAHAGTDPQAEPPRPLEELTTPSPETTPDEEPGVFVVGDQTAAGYLTPEGARNPGIGTKTNPLDPYNVNNGNHAYHQAVRDNATRGTNRGYVPPADANKEVDTDEPVEPVEPTKPPEGTPLTAEERAANGLPPLEDEEPPIT